MDVFVYHLSYLILKAIPQSKWGFRVPFSTGHTLAPWACPCTTEDVPKVVAGCSWATEDKSKRRHGPKSECTKGGGRAAHTVPGLWRKGDGFLLKKSRDPVSDMVHPCQCCVWKRTRRAREHRALGRVPPLLNLALNHLPQNSSLLTNDSVAPCCVTWLLILY